MKVAQRPSIKPAKRLPNFRQRDKKVKFCTGGGKKNNKVHAKRPFVALSRCVEYVVCSDVNVVSNAALATRHMTSSILVYVACNFSQDPDFLDQCSSSGTESKSSRGNPQAKRNRQGPYLQGTLYIDRSCSHLRHPINSMLCMQRSASLDATKQSRLGRDPVEVEQLLERDKVRDQSVRFHEQPHCGFGFVNFDALCVCLGQEVAAKSVVVPKERAPAKRRSRRHRIEKKRKKKEKKKKERTRANPSEHVRENVIE